MAEPSNLTPNQEEVMEENVQPAEENRPEEMTGEMPAEASERPTVPERRADKGKGKVREQEAVMLYAILKGYKINIGAIIENSIMRYHDGNKRGLIPHPATVTILCLKAGVKGDWETEEEVPLASPLLLTGVTKGPRNQKKKGVLIKTGEEAPTAEPEGENSGHPMGANTFPGAGNEEHDEGIPMDFSFPLASSPPRQSRTFGEQGESSRGANENQAIMELLLTIQKKMEEREQRWNIQQQFRDSTYEAELKRRDQQLEEELQRREEKFEAELQRREQKFEKELQRRENRFEAESRRREQEWEKKLKGKEDQVKEILRQQGEDFKREMKERDRDLMQELKLSHEAFYNNQFIRDSQLLTLIKEKELEKDTRWGEQLNGIKVVCKVLQKDFENKLNDRDKAQRDTDSYRQKEWLENLDLINNNLSKFLEVMTEMEVKMNNLGKRQDQLNEKVDLSNEIFIEEQAEKESQKRKERMEMKFPTFPEYLDTIDLDPPDIYTSKQKKRKK